MPIRWRLGWSRLIEVRSYIRALDQDLVLELEQVQGGLEARLSQEATESGDCPYGLHTPTTQRKRPF